MNWLSDIVNRLGRSWFFTMGILMFGTLFLGYVVYSSPNQWKYAWDVWFELVKWLILGTTGLKVGQKGLTAIADSIKAKREASGQ